MRFVGVWFKFREPVLIQVLKSGCDELTQNFPPLFPSNTLFPLQLSPSPPLPSTLPSPSFSSPLSPPFSPPHLLLSPIFWSPLFLIFYFLEGQHASYINDHDLTITNPIMKKSKFLSVLTDEDLYHRVT